MERKTKMDDAGPASSPAPPIDKTEIARIEALNGLKQFDAAMAWVDRVVNQGQPFNLTTVDLCELNHLATVGTNSNAGVLRNHPIGIENSLHQCPPWEDVIPHLAEMCDYVNSHWSDSTPLHLASFVMWRLNWIHPFSDGNGRTSRMISYVILNMRLGFRLPGSLTIPDQITKNKGPYYQALDAADHAFKGGVIDVSVMEELMRVLLARQLVGVFQNAGEVLPALS